MYEAYNILQRREDTPLHANDNDGVSFAQNGQWQDLSNVRCFSCYQLGHDVNSFKCPNHDSNNNNHNNGLNNKNNTGGGPHRGDAVNALMFMFYQSGQGIPKSWILLDS